MQTDQLVASLVKAQAVIQQPKKNATNPHFKNKFADLGACMDAVREPLNSNGLVLTQTTRSEKDAEGSITTFLVTTLHHVSGQSLSTEYPLNPVKHDPQGLGSALTYARRYALCALLGLVADTDDDGEAASRATPADENADAGARFLFQAKTQLARAKSLADITKIEALGASLPADTKAELAQLITAAKARLEG